VETGAVSTTTGVAGAVTYCGALASGVAETSGTGESAGSDDAVAADGWLNIAVNTRSDTPSLRK
jgi:hypothetical protein